MVRIILYNAPEDRLGIFKKAMDCEYGLTDFNRDLTNPYHKETDIMTVYRYVELKDAMRCVVNNKLEKARHVVVFTRQ